MKKLIGFLLVTSVWLYSTPLKADSYENAYSQSFDACSDGSSDCDRCEVVPETTTDQKTPEDQDLFLKQDSTSTSEEQRTRVDTGTYADQETLVSPENPDHSKQGRSKRWQNIFLAVAVVAAAITALLLVNSHQGHKKH